MSLSSSTGKASIQATTEEAGGVEEERRDDPPEMDLRPGKVYMGEEEEEEEEDGQGSSQL